MAKDIHHTSRKSSRRHSVVEALDTYQDVELRSIRKTKIKDLLINPEYKKMSIAQCHKQLPYLPRESSEKICNCLNTKNGDMTLEELETATEKREETPGSMCITLYDKLKKQSAKHNTKTHKSQKKSSKLGKSKITKSRKSKSKKHSKH